MTNPPASQDVVRVDPRAGTFVTERELTRA